VLEEYKLLDSVPKFYVKCHRKGLRGEVMETLKKGETLSCNFYNILVATNYEACTEMELFFKSKDHNTPYLGSSVQGEAGEVAKVIGGIAEDLVGGDVLTHKPLHRFTGFAEKIREDICRSRRG